MNEVVKDSGLTLRQLQAVAGLNLLQMLAMQRRTTTYEDFAVMCGLPSSGNALGQATGAVLGDIYRHCRKIGIPPLSVLVVRKSGSDQGLPGAGFWKLYDPERVFNRDAKLTIAIRLTQQAFECFETLGVNDGALTRGVVTAIGKNANPTL